MCSAASVSPVIGAMIRSASRRASSAASAIPPPITRKRTIAQVARARRRCPRASARPGSRPSAPSRPGQDAHVLAVDLGVGELAPSPAAAIASSLPRRPGAARPTWRRLAGSCRRARCAGRRVGARPRTAPGPPGRRTRTSSGSGPAASRERRSTAVGPVAQRVVDLAAQLAAHRDVDDHRRRARSRARPAPAASRVRRRRRVIAPTPRST